MLFYSQIKREFSKVSWRHGQNYFFAEKVIGVHLDGDLVNAKVQEAPQNVYEISLKLGRGTLSQSLCSCPHHKVQDAHCSHVAALCIWLVERGSLLRAGIQESTQELNHTALVPAQPVLFVRPIFENKVFTAIRMESALRYTNTENQEEVVETLSTLVLQDDDSTPQYTVWKSPKNLYLKVSYDFVPLMGTLNSAPIIHMGETRFDTLEVILTSKFKSQIVLHPSLNIEFEPEPLSLSSLNIGRRTELGRVLSYEFTNSKLSLSSEQISELSKLGRVANRYVWPTEPIGDKFFLFKFEMPLLMVAKYANRSGLSVPQNSNKSFLPEGYAYLEDDATHPLHPLAAYRLSLELGVKKFTVDSDWAAFHEWRKNFEKKKSPSLPEIDYGFSLRAYQTNGLSWMWSLYHRGLASLLADDMGLGKTHQVLAFLSSLYQPALRKKYVKNNLPSLVVAPTSVVAAWVQKLEKYDTGLRWQVFHGKGRILKNENVDLVLTTYGILQKEPILREREWSIVILDEAQAIKNASTISSRASRILKSKFKIAMTGTPIENQSTDLWSVMEFLLPGYLGSLPRFKRLYGAGRDIPNAQQAEALKRLVSPFLLRRTKSQVLTELPEKTEEIVHCELSETQRKTYRNYLNSAEASKIRDELSAEGKKIDYAGILALLTRLKQVCDHPHLPEVSSAQNSGKALKVKKLNPLDSGKWEAFEEIVNEALGSNLKIVIFTQYLGMIGVISEWLSQRNIGFVELRGATVNRAKPLEQFAKDPECKVFVCSLLAGGLGIDLTAGSVCIHFDRWWNPAKENQATDRLHRIGQTRGVQVFKLMCPGTIEDRIAAIIESKTALSETLIEESPLGLKAFSRKELLSLLSDVE